MLTAVFLDTSALIAATAKRDQNHDRAVETFRQLAAEGRAFLATNYVLAEAYTLARRRVGHAAAMGIADALVDGAEGVTLVHVADDEEREALELLREQADKAYSFADATSFIVMRRRGMTEAFTFDREFLQAGFTMIPTPSGPA